MREDFTFSLQEYFASGTAMNLTNSPTRASYTTRILVERPADPKKFNGTVLVEWINVSAQYDIISDPWRRRMITSPTRATRWWLCRPRRQEWTVAPRQ
jgi:hypothetical protein